MGRYPWAEVLLFQVLRIIVFYPTRNRVYRAVVLAAIFYVAARVYLTSEVTDPVTVTYLVGATTASYLAFIAYILCAEGTFPDHWRRVRDEVGTGADPAGFKNLPSNFPLTKKLWWMLDIAHSPRMVGWVQEPRGHLRPHPPPLRRSFLWKTFLKFVVNAFIVPDILTLVLAQTPVLDSRLHDPTDGPETYLAAVPLLRRVPYVLAYAIRVASYIRAPHNFAALLCVGLGSSSPTLWPDMWGRWEDTYTVRNLWGYAI